MIAQNQLLPHIFTITSATQYTAKHKAQGLNAVFRTRGYQSMDAHPKRGIDTKRNETNAPSTKLTLNANMEELHEFLYQKGKRGVHDLFRQYEKLINWRA